MSGHHRVLIAISLATVSTTIASAQGGGPSSPGRNPRQPIDTEYTDKIRRYTSERFFLSPLIDYLPRSKTVPTPAVVLGDIAGAPNILPYSSQVHDYMRRLAKATRRVKVVSIGKSEEGREMIAVAIASEKLMGKLEANRAKLAQLADPRTIDLDDRRAAKLIEGTAPVYYITGALHSPETGAPTALMELAYRLAVDESDYIQTIRDNVITLITPVTEVDGRDRQVDLFKWHLAHPNDVRPSLVYWGHYVGHDNNRDAMGLTLALSRAVLDTYLDWKAQVIHDLHESVPYLYDNTIGDGPYNAWLDPILTNEWQMIGWNNVQEMTRMGLPGVWAFGTFDTWSPGYLMFLAAMHNGISRLYETFGNEGSAETLERELQPGETSRTWYRQNPPLPKVMWSLRNNNNYQQTGLLVSLNHFALNRKLFLENFYQKSKRSILKARTEGPAAYLFPADTRRKGAQAELLRTLRRQHVEISRTTKEVTLVVGIKRSAGDKSDDKVEADTTPKPIRRTFPAGSYVVRMDQPYSRIADALLDYQYWSPNDPQKFPYDDTGWTFPEGFGAETFRVTDTTVLKTKMEPVTEIRATGGIEGQGPVTVIEHDGDNALMTLRYRFPKGDFQTAEGKFEMNGRTFRRGSILIRGIPREELHNALVELGLVGHGASELPTSVSLHEIKAARIALIHTWIETQTEGWWRQAFDFLSVPYDYLSVQDVAATTDLRAKYDVLIFAPASGGDLIVTGLPMWRNPMPWKKTPETPNIGDWAQTDDLRPGLGSQGLGNLQRFVQAGGVLITASSTSDLAIRYNLAPGVTAAPSSDRVVGSLLRSRIVDSLSPITYGMPDSLAVYSEAGLSFRVSRMLFGGGLPPEESRPTGRGTSEERDVPQGRPRLEPRFEATKRPKVEPWEAAPLTEEQLRNPLMVIPPQYRPRVLVRFGESHGLLVSGLLGGGGDMAERPIIVDSPQGKGHVILFAINPIWRGSTIGSYFFVFNAILNFDNLDVGRNLDPK